MKIGILQTGHAPDAFVDETGDYDVMFQRLLDGHGFNYQTWNVVDMEFPHGPNDADGWLITGSKHGAYEDHPFIPPLEKLIRAIRYAGRPLIGICFGHQIIAQALGGKVIKYPGGWAVGRQTYETPDGPFVINAWHQDQVIETAEDARTIAGNAFCKHAALAYGNTVLTYQPHPEFDATVIDGLIVHRGAGLIPEDQLMAASAELHEPTDRLDIGTKMANFFLKNRQSEAA